MGEQANYALSAPLLPSAERLAELQALRNDVRKKVTNAYAVGPAGKLGQAVGWFRLDCILDEADEIQRAYATLVTQLAASETAAAELLARATRAEAKAAGLLVELGDAEAEKLAEILASREAHVSERNVTPLYEAARLLKQCRRPDLAKVVMFEMSCHSSALNRLRKLAPPASAPVAPVAGVAAGEGQVPGIPQAQCHGCGLPSHVARCQSAACPMKGGQRG